MADADAEAWADAATRLRHEIVRRPYLALLAGGGVGWLLAGSFALWALPGLVNLGIRVAVLSTLPTLAEVVSEVVSPDL